LLRDTKEGLKRVDDVSSHASRIRRGKLDYSLKLVDSSGRLPQPSDEETGELEAKAGLLIG
jgi:hypothetical protein